MKFAIVLCDSPLAPSSRRALHFAEATLAAGHEIVRLFFYQDGVWNALATLVPPQDEQDLAAEWQRFIQHHQLDAVVCVAAALRRGVLDSAESQRHSRPSSMHEGTWQLSGLGQLHEAIQAADRLICFGGP